ncbi:sulfotransferase family protein [Mycobacterium sp. 852013-51886_SCH5428379]|uniref:sulfotransferase family protein n=1 Tax=Mycobacterium sp. 852013-51886_SCH5428379 TaxID=1834111 RepID=UPI0009ED2CF6|nr:sulfotransferase [Mycobacterium sp. 852013-51886_SCH5428379]
MRESPAAPSTTPRPVVLFVLGFGRSGTSALARVLSLCGAKLPPRLLGATADNPRGFWEPRAAIHLNEAILRSRRSSAYDLAMRPPDGATSPEQDAVWINRIQKYFAALPPAPLVIVKEPKITALIGLWFEGARRAGFDVAAVVAMRHPAEASASIEKRASKQNYVRSSPELGSAWWLKYTLLAERDTRDVPRVIVEFENLLEDWRREVKRIGTGLQVDLDNRNDIAIEEFLSPGLRHHRHSGPVAEPFGTDWVKTVYDELGRAARDDPWDRTVLDRVFDQYQAGERGFRTAVEDSQRYRNLNRLLLPPLVKVGLETLALVHRRRGTWA